MSRYSNAELREFREISHCAACVHYSGCQLWLALLLMNDELIRPGLDIVVPDITKAFPFLLLDRSSQPASIRPPLKQPPVGTRLQHLARQKT